jgi:xanthine dehydrogenase YagS FAD-binding subunit
MKPFQYLVVRSEAEAFRASAQPDTMYFAGGTTVVDLMQYEVWQPDALVDITALPFRGIRQAGDQIQIGALETMTDVAYHPAVNGQFPALSQSLLLAASQQLRNVATIGGNIMQRSRCPYLRDPSYAHCNRRVPGSGCDALEGVNRYHAIVGGSAHCIAAHASDLCVALAAFEATLTLTGPQGTRQLSFTDFHRLPGEAPQLEHNLRPGELIQTITIRQSPATRNSGYVKVRDRNSYAFALVSVAAGLSLENGLIREARLAIGGIGTVPWKAREAEAYLLGKVPSPAVFEQAGKLAVAGAVPRKYNTFKVGLTPRVVVDACQQLLNL